MEHAPGRGCWKFRRAPACAGPLGGASLCSAEGIGIGPSPHLVCAFSLGPSPPAAPALQVGLSDVNKGSKALALGLQTCRKQRLRPSSLHLSLSLCPLSSAGEVEGQENSSWLAT